jgi:phosphoesterase RecJ-like protein
MDLRANECAAYLAGHDGYLLISHRRPDGDTLGSGAALCSALRRAGKTAYCIENPEITENYRPFIAPYFAPEGFRPSCVVTVDVAGEGTPAPVNLALDHHPSNSHFAENTCLAADKSSCGELVLEVIKALCGSVSREEATLLYIAVSTDTGCFQYSNTNSATLRAAAELIDLGADNSALNIRFFRTQSRARMALEGRMLSGMQFFRNGEISVVTVTLQMLAECGAVENDCEDLAGLAGKAEGSVVSMTIRETKPGESKISLRSKPGVNVSEICAVYGGGGHAMAAGCTLGAGPEEALRLMLRAIDEKWPEE